MNAKKRIAAGTALAVCVSLTAGMSAAAAQNGFSIDMTDLNDEAWTYVAMTNDDTVSTGACIRTNPTQNSKAVGYLYRGGAVRVIDKGAEWTEVESGGLHGFIRNDCLTYGTEAKGLAEYYGSYGVSASWDDVNVFSWDDKNAEIIDTVDNGTTYEIENNNGHWIEVKNGSEGTAYVSEEDVDLVILVDTAVSVDDKDGQAAAEAAAAAIAPYTEDNSSDHTESWTDTAQAEETYYEDTSYTEDTSYYEDTTWTEDTSYTEDTTWTDDSSYTEDTTWTDDSSYTEDTTWTDDSSYTEDTTWTDDGSYTEDTSWTDDGSYTEDTSWTDDGSYTEDTSWSEDTYSESYDDGSSDEVYSDETYIDDSSSDDVYYEDVTDDDTTYDEGSGDDTYTEEVYEEEYEDTSSSTSASSSDVDLLAALIYCEAGNQPYEGQVAVGAVVMNRIASGSFPNTISEVIYQSGQFTPAYSGSLASALASGAGSNYYDAAYEALAGSDPTGGALYFNTSHGSGVQIGAHWFY